MGVIDGAVIVSSFKGMFILQVIWNMTIGYILSVIPILLIFVSSLFEIKQVIDRKQCTSIPDMWILYADGTEEIREVKYEKDLVDDRVRRQINTQREYCKDKGIVHRIVTDKHLRTNNYLLSNYKSIIQILKSQTSYDKHVQDLIMDTISSHSLSIQDISTKRSIPINNLIPNVALLLFKGILFAELENSFFGNRLEVYLRHEEK